MKLIYIFLAVLLIAISVFVYKSGLFSLGNSKYKQATIIIHGEKFRVEVADTLVLKALGLGGREELMTGSGMFFVFDSLATRTFWMKDVKFPIDIIWIAGDKVVGFAENTVPHANQALGEIARYQSPEPVDRVLEVPAGVVKEVGIVVGDDVEVNFEG